MLKGSIFIYNEHYKTIAYTNDIKSNYSIVLIGGLNHNILSLPYTNNLNEYCIKKNIELVIPQFRSHPNYGIYTIDNDIEDLKNMLSKLNTKVILLGNSSGCQAIVLYLSKYKDEKVIMCVLQGPVSDVEYEEYKDIKLSDNLKIAEEYQKIILEKNISLVMPFKHEFNYITPERYLSLFKRYGKEDLFSSYLTSMINLQCKTIFVISGNDEYSTKEINFKTLKFANSNFYLIKEGDHFLTKKSDIYELIQILDKELQEIFNEN